MANVYIKTKTMAVFRDKTRRLGIIGSIAALMVFFSMLAWVNLPKASAVGADDFVTTWNSGADRIVKIPIYKNATTATQYNFTVDWGDGTTENFVGNSVIPTHGYVEANTEYQIRISGVFYGWTFDANLTNAGSASELSMLAGKLRKLDQWGAIEWRNMSGMFFRCSNMIANYSDTPNTTQVADMSNMFYEAKLFNGQVNFNTSSVTKMGSMFAYAASFNQSLASFDTSKVTSMSSMFTGAALFNQPLNNFNTSRVISMYGMFSGARSFNQSLSGFDTSKVTSMSSMFTGAALFNQPLNNFNTSNVTNMSSMFSNATSFNQSLTHQF